MRKGDHHAGGPRKIVRKFNELLRQARLLTKSDWTKDPLWKALQRPFDWRVDTHASTLDEEFAGMLFIDTSIFVATKAGILHPKWEPTNLGPALDRAFPTLRLLELT